MDSRRFLLALALSVAVIFGMQYLFPAAVGVKGKGAIPPGDTVAAGRTPGVPATPAPVTQPGSTTVASAAAPTVAPTAAPTAAQGGSATASVQAETTTVTGTRPDSGAVFRVSSIGAAPVAAVMRTYPNRAPGRSGPVNLAATRQPIIKYQLVTNGGAPVDLGAVPFQPVVQRKDVVAYQAPAGAIPGVAGMTLQYQMAPDSFAMHVTGTVAGAAGKSYVVVNLPTTMPVTEPDTSEDLGYFSYAYRSQREGARNVAFHSLDPGQRQTIEGPVTWVAAKSKYFVVGVLAPKNGPPFAEADLVGGTRTSKVATSAAGSVVVPVQKNGRFAFDVYAGPQEWQRLNAMGRSFDEVNPYGWAFLRGALQPIAAGVIQLVLWMHSRLFLSYGWVLIALGVLVRLVMWPLYQSSMRTSLKMQVMQPELQAVQDRYKDDPEKQRTEVMKVYQEHGMSPLSPIMGCLPSLLPMPVLFALFFVFKNTIEFRGVHFLWLPDLSARDPYYLLPLLMGVSMYLVSWLGMRGTPPNPQAKMMSYMMPAMFTLFFFRAAAGLNLYYATQNIAALPQQWHLTRERAKVRTNPAVKGGAVKAAGGAVAPARAAKGIPGNPPGGRKGR